MDAESVTAQPYLSRDYVDLQVRFAERVAEASGAPLDAALLRYTNLHRRMGLGVPGLGEPAAVWANMVDGIAELPHAARVARIHEMAERMGDGGAVLLPGRVAFGCFACEPPDTEGMVRIHFGNRVPQAGAGPLHSSRIAERRGELTEMVGWLARKHPGARRIDGGSWLYNLDAYRRLFPPEFAASRDPRNGPEYLHGLSTWGQFIDYRAQVRPDVRDRFLAALPALDMAAPHRVFPYQVLFTTAPFEAFLREYGV